MRVKKVFWFVLTLFLLGLCVLLLTNIQYQQSSKNRFELDIDDYYNEDLLLYDPNDDFQDTMV